jgi:2-dehydropantoate 2-reductase
LTVESLQGDFVLPPQQATDRLDAVGPVDAVLLAVKAWQVSEAAEALRSRLHAGSLVVPLQNGVDAPGRLVSVLGPEPVVGGLCRIVCEVVAPGHVRHFGAEPSLDMGPLPAADAERAARQLTRCQRLRQAFENAGVRATVRDDILVGLWEKLLFIVAVSGVGAVHRAALGVLRANPETRELLRCAMAEVEAVARARGIDLAPDIVARTLAAVDRLPAGSTASMQRDLAAGRRSELEDQNGAVVRLGKESGIATPVNEWIYASLRPREAEPK